MGRTYRIEKPASLICFTQIQDSTKKKEIARSILEGLPEWFGIEQAREEYIEASAFQPFFAAMTEQTPLGFLTLKQTGKESVEIAVMGVDPAFHHQGIGKALFEAAKAYAQQRAYAFMQVKTVAMGRYENYDRTNLFYRALGFKELEVLETLWDEANPCQIYIMTLKPEDQI